MDQEVAKTLGDLELKLQELERELTTIGHRDTPAEPPHAPGKLIDEAVEQTGESLEADAGPEEVSTIDGDAFGGPAVFGGEEVPAQGGATSERGWTVEVRETAYGEIPTPPSPSTASSSSPLSTPHSEPLTPPWAPAPLAPPEPPSSEPGATPPSTPAGVHPPSIPHGIHPPSSPRGSPIPPPQAPDPRRPAAVEENQSVDLAELVRFRDKLAQTMDELIDEYSRLLSATPSSRSRPDA